MARQAANGFDAELIARAMNFLTERAKQGDHGLQYKPRGSIFGILARALRITEPDARRLISELQRRKLIELLNVGPGPRLIVVKPVPAERKRRRTRRKPEPQPEEMRSPSEPSPDDRLVEEAAPVTVELSELAAIDLAAQIQLRIEKLVARRDELLNAVLLVPRTIPMTEVTED